MACDKSDAEPILKTCLIEASVVTGFEESAKGEAKEKFGTDVKSQRGKITWTVPIDRVTEASSMFNFYFNLAFWTFNHKFTSVENLHLFSYGPKRIVGNLQKISGRYGQR